jgi:hypothetical protein
MKVMTFQMLGHKSWFKSGHVYAVRVYQTGIFKIGIASRSVESRLSGMQTDCPLLLVLAATLVAPVEYLGRVEFRAHTILRNYRMRGEWFDLGKQWRPSLTHALENAAKGPWHPSVDVESLVLPHRGGRTELPQQFTAPEISQSDAIDIASVLELPG